MKTHPELSFCQQARHLGRGRESEQDHPHRPHGVQHREAEFDPKRVCMVRYGAR